MKPAYLAFCLVMTSANAYAVTCDAGMIIFGAPCTPPPGPETDKAKQDILDRIEDAQRMERDLKKLEAAYLRVRRKGSAEEQYKACEAYYDKKKAQDALYKDALKRTEAFYHIKPIDRAVTIGTPSDPSIAYISGLRAEWNPNPSEYNPDGMLAVKIRDKDGHDHYVGVVRDEKDGGQKLAATLENGSVLIFREAFSIALRYKNPGYVGHLLFHEAQHFNQLSRDPAAGSTERRGWASPEEDEKEAFYYDAAWAAHAFDLDPEDITELNRQLKKYKKAVAKNELTWRNADPAKEALRKEYYEQRQVNLEEEYAGLHAQVRATRREQEQRQALEREERARLAQEQERQRRAAEIARQQKRQAELDDRRRFSNEAARCGYDLNVRSHEDDTVIGFKGLNALHYFTSDGMPSFDSKDIQIIFLITRACDALKNNYIQDACNDSAADIHERASNREFKAKLDHMLGLPTENYDGATRACADFFLANSNRISDTRSFGKIIEKYRRHLLEKEREHKKRWDTPPREETPPPNDGAHGPRPPTNDSDCRRSGDPFGCQPRHP